MTKSANFLSESEVEITIDLNTVFKSNNKETDLLLAVDNSEMMGGDRLTQVKEATIDLVNSLLTDGDNKMGLITFNSSSEIVSNFTNDIVNLTEKVNDLTSLGNTSYYRALEKVDEMLKNYKKEDNRECIVLFLASTKPSLDIPNDAAYYQYLKQQYPDVKFYAIQYEMGDFISNTLKNISDNQYLANSKTLNDVLINLSLTAVSYDMFTITDYIDTNYFDVLNEDDIEINNGSVSFNKDLRAITWNLDKLNSGGTARMTILAKLKDGIVSKDGVYQTNTKVNIESKLDDQVENVDDVNILTIFDRYRVIYDANVPEECSVDGLPTAESKAASDVVGISNLVPKCNGYQFKGWNMITKDVTKINSDYFVMPEDDVVLKGMWGKVAVEKLMNGKLATASSNLEKGEIVLDLNKHSTETLDIVGVTDVVYEIADENIVNISEDGILKGKNVGSTIVAVKGENDYQKEYKVSVQKTVSVIYKKQGIGVTGITKMSDSCVIKNDDSCKVVLPQMSVLDGYKVVGWDTDKESITGIKPGNIISLSDDTTFYSIFFKEAATYSVNFEANGNTILDIKKSCSIGRVYNGSIEGINCSVTTPIIVAPSVTPIIIGYNEDKNATLSQIGSNEILTLDEYNTGKTYYAITRKDEVIRTVTYIKGKGVASIENAKMSDSCTIAATYNGKSQVTSCDIMLPNIVSEIGYTSPMFNTEASGTGTNYSVSSKYSLVSNLTLYAVAKRDFTCASRGSTTSYAGMNWYTVANDGENCTLALNSLSKSTGTYADAETKLTSEYFTTDSKLLTEWGAGLTTVLGTYSETSGLSTNESGITWKNATTAIPVNKTFPQYSAKETSLYSGSIDSGDGSFSSSKYKTGYNTSSISSCSSVSGANCVVSNGKVSSSVNNHGSLYITWWQNFKSVDSVNFTVTSKKTSNNSSSAYTQYYLYLRNCGGTRHNKNMYRFKLTETGIISSYDYIEAKEGVFLGFNIWFGQAGYATPTTSKDSQGRITRIYNPGVDSSCVPTYKLTFSNATYPIQYRLYIKVKM